MVTSGYKVFSMRMAISLFAMLFIFVGLYESSGLAYTEKLPGVIPPSACRVGAVLSTDQVTPLFGIFTGLGRSNIRTVMPTEEVVAGTWVVMNNFVPDTGIVRAPNCVGPLGLAVDGAGLNLMGVRITTTISSPQKADIEYIKLVWDVNANGLWDPLLDLVLQEKPGSELLQEGGALFSYGPQSPLATLSNTFGRCFAPAAGIANRVPQNGVGPLSGTNSRVGVAIEGCYIALLAIVKIGKEPIHRTKFGLQMSAYAGDIPGSTGISSFSFSSGFSSSRNPQASNVWVDVFGGLPGPKSSFDHLNHGIGNPENSLTHIHFSGGENGEGLLSRFRAKEVGPGSREVILFAGGLCDGGRMVTQNAIILPAVAGAPPTIAGGLPAIPCIPGAGTDGIPTAIVSIILKVILPPELMKTVGTIRFYADIDCDGILFETGELIQQRIGYYNEPTDDIFVHFNQQQIGFIFTPAGAILAGGCPAVGGVPGVDASPLPLLLIFTADFNAGAVHGIPGAFGPTRLELGAISAQQNGNENGDGLDNSQPYILSNGDNNNNNNGGGSEESCPESNPAGINAQGDPCEDFFNQAINMESNELVVSPQNLHNSVRFAIQGAKSQSARFEIFDLQGNSVYRSIKTNPYQLRWNLRDSRKRPVANGVYLYVITAYNHQGQLIRSEVKKLVMMR
jgi:hypothetical protein